MASILVPGHRCAADALSHPDRRAPREDELNDLLAANPPVGVQPADKDVFMSILLNAPSIAVGGCINSRLHVLWNFSRLHQYGHPHDGDLLCVEGEVTAEGLYNVVKPNTNDFEVRPEVSVYSVADTISGFRADDTKTHLPPPRDTKNTKHPKLNYRLLFKIPHAAAGTLISYRNGITAREYFLEVYPTLDTLEKQTAWQRVTEHFQVLAVAEATGVNTSVAELPSQHTMVRLDDQVSNCMSAGVYQVLPDRKDGGNAKELGRLNGTLASGFQAMQVQADATRQTQQEALRLKEEEKQRKKTLKAKLGGLESAAILRLIGVASEEDIPEDLVWKKWKESDSKTPESFRNCLEVCVKEKTRLLGMPKSAPQITLAMATGIMKGEFGKESLDDLSSGWFCNFLHFGTAPIEFTKKQIQRSRDSENSGVILSPSEATELQKFRTYLPTTAEADRNILRMKFVAMACFPQGPFLTYLDDLLREWKNHYDTIKECVLSNTAWHNSRGILVLETFTIKLSLYWDALLSGSASATIEQPSVLFDKMYGREHWLPHFKPGYLASLGVKDFDGGETTFWLENMLDDGSTQVQHSVVGGTRVGGGPPPVPGQGNHAGNSTQQQQPGNVLQQQQQGTAIKNENYNDVLFGEFRRRKRDNKEITIRSFKQQAIATKPLPPSRFGADSMCLAWHVKGMCNANCRQAADHHSYSAAEYAPLVTWCQECYPAGE